MAFLLADGRGLLGADIDGPRRVRVTEYYPAAARTAAERRMEGGSNDRLGRPLHSYQQHRADGAEHPYVALSGDDRIWPYGQRVILPSLGSDLVFRVVDTGGNFSSAKTKKIRTPGAEPIDLCVDAPGTVTGGVTDLWIVVGDVLDSSGRPTTITQAPAVQWWAQVAPAGTPLAPIVRRRGTSSGSSGAGALVLVGLLGAAGYFLFRR